jgi:hypothetical protein
MADDAGDRPTKTDVRVGAANVTTSIANARAHVGAASEPISVAATRAHVGAASRLDAAILRTQAKAALTGLGWKAAIAHAAVGAALAAEGAEITLERLIFESLRQCPVRSG